MADDFDDFFGELETQKVRRARVKGTIECPILFRDTNPNLNVLVSEYFSDNQLKYIKALFHKKGAKINLVYVFSVIFDEKKKITSGMAQFFVENVRSDLTEWLISDVPIITVGRAIYATTYDVDIQIQGFYDSVFNNTYFYSPFVNNRIYPIDTIFRICAFGQADQKTGEIIDYWDRWEKHFAEKQIERAVKVGNCALPRKKSIKYLEIDDPNKWLQEHTDNIPENELWVAVDTETGGFNKLSDIIGDVTFSFDGWTAYHLDWRNKVNPKLMTEFLQKHKCIYANGKYDVLFFMFHGCDLLTVSWDTMIAGHLLNEMRSNSLKTHAFHYTNYGGYDLELEKFKWKYLGLRNYLQIPDLIRIPYACYDSAVTYQVWQAQVKAMKNEPELWDYYHKYCLPLLKVFIKAEYKGFCIDWNKVNEVGKMIKGKMKESLEDVRKVFKNPELNPNKKQELGKFIESLGWPCINRTKSGGFKVSKKEFAEWEKMGHSEVKTLLEYSKWTIIWNTFIGADSNYGEDGADDLDIDPEFDVDDSEALDGDDFFSGVERKYSYHDATGLWQYKGVDNRVHTTFYAFMTKSHRHRSSNPNLQNLPKRNKEVSSIVRQCYIPPDIVPCEITEAIQIWVFDRLNGLSLHGLDDLVEIGIEKRIKVPARELVNYDFKEYGYRAEFYRKAEPDEYVITETDGKNLQAMIAASMSHDKNLCNVFLSGGDFHDNNTYHILAKYKLFDECEITLNNGQIIDGMEWKPIQIASLMEDKDKIIYCGDVKEGTLLGALKVIKVQKKGRYISYEEFCKNSKIGKCKELRYIGKVIGLSFIFGASANNLAGGTLKMAWNPKMCADFIKDRGLQDLQESIVKSNKRLQGDSLLYFVVASFFRSEFFKLYPELEKWIFECANIASNTGYRRSPFGSRRLLPQLKTKGRHADQGMYKNLCNIAVNSPVQDFETVVMACVMIIVDSAYEDLGYISYTVGTVHDSVVDINHKSELESCMKILLEAFNFNHAATYGLPYSGECNVADYTKGEYWGFGHREVKYKDVENVSIIRKRHRIREGA
jgi:DNA polymerase I-like protein with 3'-5' exonuclease and polymerase domains